MNHLEFINKVVSQREKGLLTDIEMWEEILETALKGLRDSKEPSA